jgi:PAS domain-containing protein
VKTLANPVVLRAAVVLFCGGAAFLMSLIFMRFLRKSINEEAQISSDPTPSLETLPLHLYNTVIQQLKQQKHELDTRSQAEQQRARISETFSQAVLSNLSCGVLVFGTNGLVKTSNPAAREILGFASPSGMSPSDIFRDAKIQRVHRQHEDSQHEDTNGQEAGTLPDETTESGFDNFDEFSSLAAEVDVVLHEGCQRRQVQAEYCTPSGEKRFLAVTVSPVPASDGSLLGAACLVNDLSALESMRRQQQLRGELSAEMALQLRASLAMISGFAQQLSNSRDPELSRQLASDIAAQAAQLDRNLGSFLTEKPVGQSVAAGGTTSS